MYIINMEEKQKPFDIEKIKLDNRLSVRVDKIVEIKINKMLPLFPKRFDNISHFVRCAIINFCIKLEQEVKNVKPIKTRWN